MAAQPAQVEQNTARPSDSRLPTAPPKQLTIVLGTRVPTSAMATLDDRLTPSTKVEAVMIGARGPNGLRHNGQRAAATTRDALRKAAASDECLVLGEAFTFNFAEKQTQKWSQNRMTELRMIWSMLVLLWAARRGTLQLTQSELWTRHGICLGLIAMFAKLKNWQGLRLELVEQGKAVPEATREKVLTALPQLFRGEAPSG